MKANISIPNPIFETARRLAQKMNISLSELYTVALSAYVANYQSENVTEILDEIYAKEPSGLDAELIILQVTSIGSESW